MRITDIYPWRIYTFVLNHTFDFAKIRYFTPNPFSESHFWTFINVHFWKSQNTFGKMHVCDHNEKLASHDQKNIFQFVTLTFFYFSGCG